MGTPVSIVHALVFAHLGIQFWLVFFVLKIPGAEGVMQFLELLFMALLWYTSWSRYRRDPASLQKRFIHYAFLTWSLRPYVNLYAHNLADMMSLATVWMFVRSQSHVLNVSRKIQRRIDISLVIFEGLLLILSLIRSVQPGVAPNLAHTIVFTSSHLLYISLVFVLYARAAILSKDPTIKVRFVFLALAATLFVGLFLSDFVWRSLVPGAVGNPPVIIKDLFDVLGMLALYVAFNMSDSTRSMILLWHRIYTGQAQQRLISLVLHISEAASREEDHILPSLALRVAKHLSASDPEQHVVRQAGAVLAIIHRHTLPDMRQQWQDPVPVRNSAETLAEDHSPFEERLTELERVQFVLDSLDIPYEVNKNSGLLETEILRVVLAYLQGADISTLEGLRGKEYAPSVVDALINIVEPT